MMHNERKLSKEFKSLLALQHKFEMEHRKKKAEKRIASKERQAERYQKRKKEQQDDITPTRKRAIIALVKAGYLCKKFFLVKTFGDDYLVKNWKLPKEIDPEGHCQISFDKVSFLIENEFAIEKGDDLFPTEKAIEFCRDMSDAYMRKMLSLKPHIMANMGLISDPVGIFKNM